MIIVLIYVLYVYSSVSFRIKIMHVRGIGLIANCSREQICMYVVCMWYPRCDIVYI